MMSGCSREIISSGGLHPGGTVDCAWPGGITSSAASNAHAFCGEPRISVIKETGLAIMSAAEKQAAGQVCLRKENTHYQLNQQENRSTRKPTTFRPACGHRAKESNKSSRISSRMARRICAMV